MFVSLTFFVFFCVILLLFACVPKRWRVQVLLMGSILFVGWLSIGALLTVFLMAVFSWIMGLLIEKAFVQEKKGLVYLWMAAGILMIIGCLGIYKFGPYIVRRFPIVPNNLSGILQDLVMPVGLSFYAFQAISYFCDIHAGKVDAEKGFAELFLYFIFFPKFVSGPIERKEQFTEQLKQVRRLAFWDRGRLSAGVTYMVYGYAVKMLLADRAAVGVDLIFRDYSQGDTMLLFLGMLLYTLQIYCDFAGYSMIAVGIGKIFGIELTLNFKTPYFAASISEFWRRWHISLSSWLRDYLYIPLGGNRRGSLRRCLNIGIVFLVCGIWHGSGVHFWFWGLLHGAYSILEVCAKKAGIRVPNMVGRLLTFLSVAFAWIFFRVESLGQGLRYVARMCTAGFHPAFAYEKLTKYNLWGIEGIVLVIGIVLLIMAEVQAYHRDTVFPELILQQKRLSRFAFYYAVIILAFVFGIYGTGYQETAFIYMQF